MMLRIRRGTGSWERMLVICEAEIESGEGRYCFRKMQKNLGIERSRSAYRCKPPNYDTHEQ